MKPSEADGLIPISALRHMRYCERSAALNHVDGVWSDNRYTTEGSMQHARVDASVGESRGRLKILRSVVLRSEAHAFAGIADVVEFHLQDGIWRPIPVEYKRGKRKRPLRNGPEVQLCAQAIALEEMMAITIEHGFIFHIESKKRRKVIFDEQLRRDTLLTVRRFREVVANGEVPPPVHDERCADCSLCSRCLPAFDGGRVPVRQALLAVLRGP
jgi:CRISPR-associated exonuclease Cas4